MTYECPKTLIKFGGLRFYDVGDLPQAENDRVAVIGGWRTTTNLWIDLGYDPRDLRAINHQIGASCPDDLEVKFQDGSSFKGHGVRMISFTPYEIISVHKAKGRARFVYDNFERYSRLNPPPYERHPFKYFNDQFNVSHIVRDAPEVDWGLIDKAIMKVRCPYADD